MELLEDGFHKFWLFEAAGMESCPRDLTVLCNIAKVYSLVASDV